MHRSLLKTASILALSLFAFPVVAQSYSANVDPYGYGSVPLPPPQPQLQPMMMPAFQAQQTGGGVYTPLNQYTSQYASNVNYAGQATPQVVATPQFGVVPDYLPATRSSSYGTSATLSTPQASSVGYVVQPQNNPAPTGPVTGAVNVPAGSGYVQTQAYSYGTNAPAPVIAPAPQAYASAQYGAPSVNVQAPSIQAPTITAPTITAQAPSVNVQAPSVQAPSIQTPTAYASQSSTNSYPVPTYTAPAGSIAVAPTYDGSYQVASNAPVYQAPSYTAPSYGYQQPQVQTQGAVITQDPGQPPQVQTYAYNTPAQPAYTTQTQVYTQQPALTVQQDMGYQQTAEAAPAPSQDVSLASEAGSSPWYLAIRSGLTIPQNTNYRFAGKNWEQEFETGWQLGTAAGYEFKSFNAWLAPRAEVELTYDQALVDSHTIAGAKVSDPNAYGFVRSLDLMANGYLDFRLNRYLSPYVGGGVGVGYSDFDRLGTSANGVVMDDNDVGFVWQAMGGLGIALSSNSTVDFGYRYQQNTGLNLKAADGTVTNTDVSKHVIMIGFRNNL